MTQNLRRNLANRCNALKSTGPRSVSGKWASSQNSRKHGLNSAPVFELSTEYQTLVDLIAEEGFSAFVCADIATDYTNSSFSACVQGVVAACHQLDSHSTSHTCDRNPTRQPSH